MQTRDVLERLYNFREFSQPSECLNSLCKNKKVLYWVYRIIFKIHANLKRHNRVYILSSKHTYRPMSARSSSVILTTIKACQGNITSVYTARWTAGSTQNPTSIYFSRLKLGIHYSPSVGLKFLLRILLACLLQRFILLATLSLLSNKLKCTLL